MGFFRTDDRMPVWECTECHHQYTAVTCMRSCPFCDWEKQKLEKQYWADKQAGMRSIASDIVNSILEVKNNE